MKLAIIYWKLIHSVGGIATHLNSLRTAAIKHGDECDILVSDSQKTKHAQVFTERKWISGGDTRIWVDGELPHHPNNVAESLCWLDRNYDAICFSKICQHKTTAYPEPHFLEIYESKLPKVSLQPDGYWDMYSHWAEPLLPKLKGILPVVDSYAIPLRELGYKNIKISGVPFVPMLGNVSAKSKRPLVVWPNQWKDLKGIKPFLEQVPEILKVADVELYSCGIRYYQLRKEECWKNAVGRDLFNPEHSGNGKAIYFGNVDTPCITEALQRAWFTVNLQGRKSRKETYKRGSYNYTEIEALWYGACPILHESTKQTILPQDCYLTVGSAEEIPSVVCGAIKSGFAMCKDRREKARRFICRKHLASKRYQDIRDLLGM